MTSYDEPKSEVEVEMVDDFFNGAEQHKLLCREETVKIIIKKEYLLRLSPHC